MANKTKEALLAAYKKASKPARLVIIGRAGFTSESEYFKYLDTLKTSLFKTKEEKEAEKDENQALDMVIAFDTTGSMSSYLHAVRQHVKSLIPKLFAENKDLKMKIVAFGDYCDMPSKDNFGKAYQETVLTNDQTTLMQFVVNAQTTSGGDEPEFYELVIKKITEETPWRPTAKKAVLLIADSPPHAVGYSCGSIIKNSQIDWRVEAKKSAALGIQWDTLSCGGNTAVVHFYQPLSEMTGGINIPFKSSEKTQEIMYAATAARGGAEARAAFTTSYAAATASGDKELMGSYKSLSSLLDD